MPGPSQDPVAPATQLEDPFPEAEPEDSLASGVPYQFRTTISDAGFEHTRLDAATQATIVWENTGTQTHSVVSDDGTFAGSGPVAPGSTFTFTFQTAGDYAFHCRYHPDMTGLLVVR